MPLRYPEPAAEAYRFPLIIRHLLDGVLTRAADQRIIYRDQASFTYRELVERIGRLASMLVGVGVEQGMTVAVMDWDSHRYLESFFAVPMIGAVLQTVNVRLPVPQIAYVLRHAEAKVILIHRDFFPIFEQIRSELAVNVVVAIMDGRDEPLPPWARGEYESRLIEADPNYPFEDLDENAVATTFYTSGTTGQPKGVCFTHRQLVLHTLVECGPFGTTNAVPAVGLGDVYMPLTPMFHVHAWGMPYVATMLGLKQVYPGRYDFDMICALFSEHGVNYSHCVPTILELTLEAAERSQTDLTGWKMTVGGSALSRSLYAQAMGRGMKIGVGYGMSETCPVVLKAARRSPRGAEGEEALATELMASGISVPLVDVRICDEAMAPLPHDGQTRGELVVRAPWLTQCYTKDPDASDALWRGGWMHTQDIATIDPDGTVQIRDRIKDVVKTGGEWIDSIQLEQLVAAAAGVAEAAVIAVPDARWGERPLAVVVPQPRACLTLETINCPVEQAITDGVITRYAKLDRFVLIDQLPRTSVGKIDKKTLRALYAEERLA